MRRRSSHKSRSNEPIRKLRGDVDISSVSRDPTMFGLIAVSGESDALGTCLHCPDSPCVKLSPEEKSPSIKLETTHYPSSDICVYEAISWDSDNGIPSINEDLCVGCGACIGRCPIGAIRLNPSGKVEINNNSEKIFTETKTYSKASFHDQIKHFRELTDNVPSRCGIQRLVQNFPQVITGLDTTPLNSKLAYGLLVRNLLSSLGFSAKAGTPGDTNSRSDLVFSDGNFTGLVEIESGDTMLDATRRLITNYAIAHSRYDISKDSLEAFIVCGTFPNKRSDVYEVIENVKERLGINIRVVPLLLLVVLASYGYQAKSIDFTNGFEVSRQKCQVVEDASTILGGVSIDMSRFWGALK